MREKAPCDVETRVLEVNCITHLPCHAPKSCVLVLLYQKGGCKEPRASFRGFLVSLFVHLGGLCHAVSGTEFTTLIQINYNDLKTKICTRTLGASLGGRSARKRLA